MTANPSLLRRVDNSGIPLLVARLALGAVFLYMGVKKVQIPSEFLKQIRLYHMLPESPSWYLNGTAVVLPWLEILSGAALLLGIGIRGAALVVAGMLAVFTPAILVRALTIRAEQGIPFFDIKFDCGCGAGVVVTWKKLLENVGLFLLALLALFSHSRRFTLSGWLGRRRPGESESIRTGDLAPDSSAKRSPAF